MKIQEKICFCLFQFAFIFFLGFFCTAQQIVPFHTDITRELDRHLNKKNTEFHSSFKPYISTQIDRFISGDSVLAFDHHAHNNQLSLFQRKLRYENLIRIDTQDFHLRIDPVFYFQAGKQENDSQNYYQNTRGVRISGHFGNKFAFESGFSENQAVLQPYIMECIRKYQIIPGQGKYKNFKTFGVDYAFSYGLISYSPSKYINLQFGHGKNFIGQGYRSLLLSDNSYYYPYFKITTNVWKFQYTNLWASFIDIMNTKTTSQWAPYNKKWGSFHLLSFFFFKRFECSLFEGIIWRAADSTGLRGLDINYLNPVIFYRPVDFSLGNSPDNALIGVDLKCRLTDHAILFSQWIIDDMDIAGAKKGKGYILNKYGFQFGFKCFDLFRIPHLFFQSEYNQVRPYVYAHKMPEENYTHFNQALAHPLGANFKESVSFIHYRYKDWFVELKLLYSLYGADTLNSHWGKNIFRSDYDAERGFPSHQNTVTQGVKTTLLYKDIRFGYRVNPVTNMNIFIGVSGRTVKSNQINDNRYFVFFGIATFLHSIYYDF